MEVLLSTGEGNRWLGWWRLASEVLIRVEASNGGQICNIGQLQESVLILSKSGYAVLTLVLILVLIVPLRLGMSHFLGHRRQCDTLWQVWKWVNKSSLFRVTVVE